MNNNQVSFDPMTGQPINNTNSVANQLAMQQPAQSVVQQSVTQQPVQPATQQPVQPTIQQNDQINVPNLNENPNATISVAPSIEQPQPINIQQQLSAIPTVDQNPQQFVNNTQATNVVKKEEKKEGPNIAFIVIIFVIIFAAIFFLFPYLLELLG